MGTPNAAPPAGPSEGSRSVDALIAQGLVLVAQGNLKEAFAVFDEAVRLDPRSAAAYTARGVAHARLGRLKPAIGDHTEALKIEPSLALALRNRGRDWAALRNWKRAAADFTEAIRLEPTDAQAHCDRAIVRNRTGQYESAAADATEAIRLAPGLSLAYNARGYARLGRGSQRVFTFWKPGNAAARQADYEGAVADFTEAIRLLPVAFDCYAGRARAYRALGDTAKADRDEAVIPPQIRRPR